MLTTRIPAAFIRSRCIRIPQQPQLPVSRIRTQRHVANTTKSTKCRSFEENATFRQRFAEHWRLAKKDYPILLTIGIVAAFGSMSVLGLLIYDDLTRVQPNFSAYPFAVEHQLRKALHAIHLKKDPDKAESHFIQALNAADEAQMDPYSPEVMGIRSRLAECMEQFGRAKAAVQVLNETIKMCEGRVADLDRGVATQAPEQASQQRKDLLCNIIRSKAKVASLYESDYLQDSATAKQILSDAVGLLVKETKDPQTNGFTEDNQAGLPLTEIASLLSQMGDLYATSGEEANAVQVYMLTLQPLRAACNGTRSCKEVQVLSNIASTMDVALKKPGAKINGQPATKESLAAARKAILRWADQAIATAEVVKPDERDTICELGLISAQLTKADLLLEDGKLIQAREAFRSLIPTLQDKKLDVLVKVAEDGIQRAGG